MILNRQDMILRLTTSRAHKSADLPHYAPENLKKLAGLALPPPHRTAGCLPSLARTTSFDETTFNDDNHHLRFLSHPPRSLSNNGEGTDSEVRHHRRLEQRPCEFTPATRRFCITHQKKEGEGRERASQGNECRWVEGRNNRQEKTSFLKFQCRSSSISAFFATSLVQPLISLAGGGRGESG